MPFVNIKLVKEQVSPAQKTELIDGFMDLIISVMGRDRDKTVIVLDEMTPEQWFIGGKNLLDPGNKNKIVSFVNLKISRGTGNPAEMAEMMRRSKELVKKILGASDETNYFIIDELNPDGWGLDGIPMTIRNQNRK